MHRMIPAALCAAMAAAAGCRVVEVENRGEEIARDADGRPVTLQDGSIQTVKKGWNVYHNQHWMWTKMDTMEADVKKDEIRFSMGGLNSEPSDKLGQLVQTSFDGAGGLAAKIGAAVVTAGGSVAADSTLAAIQTLVGNFAAKGGDAAKATVVAKDGAVTVTDGSVTCTDGSCYDR